MKNIERRSFAAPEVKAGKIRCFIPYNSRSVDMGFRETILPGAFRKTLTSNDDVMAYWNHNPDLVLGSRSAGTLDFDDDDDPDGLWAEIEQDGTSWCADARAAVRSRNVRGCSFGFVVDDEDGDEWDRSSGEWTRQLKSVRLVEISPTSTAAYPASQADVD